MLWDLTSWHSFKCIVVSVTTSPPSLSDPMSAIITGTWQYYRLAFPPCFLHSLLVCVLPWSPLSPSEFSEWKVETGRQEISAFFPKVLKNVSWDEDPGQWLLLETDSLHGMVHWLAVCNSALEWITHTHWSPEDTIDVIAHVSCVACDYSI